MKKNSFLIIIIVLFAGITLAVFHTQEQEKVSDVIERGLTYIYENQRDTGEVPSFVCEDRELTKNCVFDTNFFITASTLYSLRETVRQQLDHRTASIISRGVHYYLNNIPQNYIWKFWPEEYIKIDPDLDDTSLISFVLLSYGYKSNNHSAINANRNSDGHYYTWLNKTTPNNDIDLIVNTNVALYLNDDEVSQEVCSFVSRVITEGLESTSYLWYVDNYDLYYAISRAYSNGIKCFGDKKNLIVLKIIADQRANGAIGNNELSTALALNTLKIFEYKNQEFYKRSFNYLLSTQQTDGGWAGRSYFTGRGLWWGSRSYTTAVVLEAIARYYLK